MICTRRLPGRVLYCAIDSHMAYGQVVRPTLGSNPADVLPNPIPSQQARCRLRRARCFAIDVGLALLEIRDQRLYREAGYRTFEEYCKERWGWSICHVNRPSPWRPMLASSSPTHAWQPTRPLAYVVASSTTWYCRPDVGW
jgi:hypothetical protein